MSAEKISYELKRFAGAEVLASIAEVGYYLQMPPAEYTHS